MSADLPRPPRPVPLATLVVDDGSPLATAVAAALDRQLLEVSRVPASGTEASVLDARCRDAHAVLFVTDGWDGGTAAIVDTALPTVLTALRGSGKKLVYVSPVSVIGDTGHSFGNEDSPASPGAAHQWQRAVEARTMRSVTTGVHSIIVRPALVHGAGAGALLQGLLERARSHHESVYVGDGTALTSTVHVDDLARLLQAAVLHAPEATTYMAASDERLSWLKIATLVAAASPGGATLRSITAQQADLIGLDGAAMSISSVIHDAGPLRRLRWTAVGPTLTTELDEASHRR